LILIFSYLPCIGSIAAAELGRDNQLKLNNYFKVMPPEMKAYDDFEDKYHSPGSCLPIAKELTDIVNVGNPIVPELIRRLDNKDRFVSESAQYALALITNKQFSRLSISKWKNWWETHKRKSRVQWLIDDLDCPDFETSKDAAIYLGETGDKKAVSALKAKLNDPQINPELKTYVSEALKNLQKSNR